VTIATLVSGGFYPKKSKSSQELVHTFHGQKHVELISGQENILVDGFTAIENISQNRNLPQIGLKKIFETTNQNIVAEPLHVAQSFGNFM